MRENGQLGLAVGMCLTVNHFLWGKVKAWGDRRGEEAAGSRGEEETEEGSKSETSFDYFTPKTCKVCLKASKTAVYVYEKTVMAVAYNTRGWYSSLNWDNEQSLVFSSNPLCKHVHQAAARVIILLDPSRAVTAVCFNQRRQRNARKS